VDALVFLAEGFEELEAVTPLDLMRRAGLDVGTVSLTGKRAVTGSHGVTIQADTIFEDITQESAAAGMLVLPGGPGTSALKAHRGLHNLLMSHYSAGKKLGAICAAPSVLAMLGLLDGKKAVCHPSVRDELSSADLSENPVETDGQITTSRGAGTALNFGLALVRELKGAEAASKIGSDIIADERIMGN